MVLKEVRRKKRKGAIKPTIILRGKKRKVLYETDKQYYRRIKRQYR